jgi:transcriptional regulator with XRE-family HTH domain
LANGRGFEPTQLFFSALKWEIVRENLGKETQPAQNGIESAEIGLCGLWGSWGLELAWSQGQLAEKVNVHQKQISGYERNTHSPSTDLLVRIAQALNVSLDYLVFEGREDVQQVAIGDLELLEKLKEIDQLPPKDREIIKSVLDTFIIKNRFNRLANG